VPNPDQDRSSEWAEYRIVAIALLAAIATLLVHG